MQFLALFTPKKDVDGKLPADFAHVEIDEQAQSRVLYAQGALRSVWALVPTGTGAAAIFEADDEQHMEHIIETFPLIQREYAYVEVLKLAPHPAFIGHS